MIPSTWRRKRSRRPPRPDAGAGTTRCRDWASLHEDLIRLIGGRLLAGGDMLHDYVRFRAACRQWRSTTDCPRGRGVVDPRFHPRRWMMLPEGHGLYPGHPRLCGYVRFFSLSTGNVVRAHLPLLDDHAILDSVDGLLLLHRDHDTAIRLLHPFTGDIAELPPLDSLQPQLITMEPDAAAGYLRTVCAAIAVSTTTGAVAVTLAFPLLHRVTHATCGAHRWTLSTWKLLPLFKPVSFQGKLYAIHLVYEVHDEDEGGTRRKKKKRVLQVYQIDYDQLPEKIAECPRDIIPFPINLVECGSELLLIGSTDTARTRLLVYRLTDLISSSARTRPITSIGDHALFLDERPLCVSSPSNMQGLISSSIRRNSIICIRIVSTRERVQQYRLDTGMWTPASDAPSTHRLPQSPCTLFHHIFTCCRPEYWNKGLMFCRETEPRWPVKQNMRIGA